MGINVSTSMGFENREFLKNTAKSILQKNGADNQAAEETIQNIDFKTSDKYSTDLSILRASTQVTLNKSLKETLNYLKAHANDKRKKEYVLGELWQDFTDESDSYQGELKDIVINFNENNIFAA